MDIDKEKLGTITGISNFQEWTWPQDPQDEQKNGYIYARALPGIGIWKEYSPDKIEKIVKKRKFEKPNPKYTQHTEPSKIWTMPIVGNSGKFFLVILVIRSNLIILV